MRTDTRLPEIQVPEAPSAPARGDRFPMVSLAVVAVWIAVGAMSLFSPDLITGSEHEHLPLVAMTVWFWAAIATGFVVMTGASGREPGDGRWRGFALVIAAIWAVVAVASILHPDDRHRLRPDRGPDRGSAGARRRDDRHGVRLPLRGKRVEELAASGFVSRRSDRRGIEGSPASIMRARSS